MDSISFKLSGFKNTTGFRQNSLRDQKLNVSLLKSQIDLHLRAQEKNQNEVLTNYLIMDLDGTIMSNWTRQIQIILQKILPNYPHLQKSEILVSLTREQSMYSIFPILEPFCNSSEEFMQIKQKFLDHFLSNRFLDQDRLFPGVNSFIEWLWSKNIHIVFLTGRPKSRMQESTRKFLFNHIPSLKRIPFTLSMKEEEISDFDHKQAFLEQMRIDPNNNLVAFIDNESEMCSLASVLLPECLVVHFNSFQSKAYQYSGYKLQSWQ
ncbi:MAG: HAD family hydrolase [Promethearchaeota archaeon]